jgi:hypothetical protein
MVIREFIKSLGGPTRLAADLQRIGVDVKANTIQVWCDRGRIPPKWLPKIARFAAAKGVTPCLPDEVREFIPANLITAAP